MAKKDIKSKTDKNADEENKLGVDSTEAGKPVKHKTRYLAVIIAVFGVLFVGISFFVVYEIVNKASNRANVTQNPKDDIASFGITEASDSVDASMGTATPENYKQKMAQLESEVAAAKDDDSKLTLLQGAALIAFNNQDYDSCIVIAKKSDAVKKDAVNAALIADCSYNKNDFKTAVEYYGIAADRSDKTSDPTINSPYNDYKIKQKEAQQRI